jgi:hypothetical protein
MERPNWIVAIVKKKFGVNGLKDLYTNEKVFIRRSVTTWGFGS